MKSVVVSILLWMMCGWASTVYAINCDTNCAKVCHHWWGTDPVCASMCQVERSLVCRKLPTSCDYWKHTNEGRTIFQAMQKYVDRVGEPSSVHQCHKDIDLDSSFCSAGSGIHALATKTLEQMVEKTLSLGGVVGFVAVQAAFHLLHCGCNEIRFPIVPSSPGDLNPRCTTKLMEELFLGDLEFEVYMRSPRNAAWWCKTHAPSAGIGDRCYIVNLVCRE